MVDYDPNTKLYRVKRVYVPNHILERKASVTGQEGEGERCGDEDVDEGAGRVSDGEQKAEAPEETARASAAERKEVYTMYSGILLTHEPNAFATPLDPCMYVKLNEVTRQRQGKQFNTTPRAIPFSYKGNKVLP